MQPGCISSNHYNCFAIGKMSKKMNCGWAAGFFLSSLGGGLASDWSGEKARSLYRPRQPQRAAETRVKLSVRKGRRQKRLNFNIRYS